MKINTTEGYSKCPTWLRKAYIKAVKNYCQCCHKKFEDKDFIIHRVFEGYKGGLYVPENCRPVCKECSKNIHWNEF